MLRATSTASVAPADHGGKPVHRRRFAAADSVEKLKPVLNSAGVFPGNPEHRGPSVTAPDENGFVAFPRTVDKIRGKPLIRHYSDSFALNPRDFASQGGERKAVFRDAPSEDSAGLGGGLEDVA